MLQTIRTTLARWASGLAYALAPAGSDIEDQLRPIWRPGSQ